MRFAGSRALRYPSKKARAVLNAGVGIPSVTAVATTRRHDSCTIIEYHTNFIIISTKIL